MKTYINRKPVSGAWGGGNHFVKAIYRHLSEFNHELIEADNSTVAPDVMLLAGIDNDGIGISAEQAVMYKHVMQGRRDVKVILRVNENDARKGTNHVDDMLLTLSEHVDGTVFVSEWLQEYFEKKGWSCTNNTVIKNGVDHDIFKPGQKFNDGKIHIVTHHWSDNYLKGFDIYDKLDEWVGQNPDFVFTYIGRHRRTFKNTIIVPPTHGKMLGEILSKHDVYVSASRFDPGPNHISESVACGIPTYVHKDGGGSIEFAGKDHVYDTWDDLVSLLESKKFSPNPTQFSDWKTCVQQYAQFLEDTCKLV